MAEKPFIKIKTAEVLDEIAENGLTPQEFGVLMTIRILAKNAQKTGKKCTVLVKGKTPKIGYFAHTLNVQKRTAKRVLDRLVELGLLGIDNGAYFCHKMLKAEGKRQSGIESAARRWGKKTAAGKAKGPNGSKGDRPNGSRQAKKPKKGNTKTQCLGINSSGFKNIALSNVKEKIKIINIALEHCPGLGNFLIEKGFDINPLTLKVLADQVKRKSEAVILALAIQAERVAKEKEKWLVAAMKHNYSADVGDAYQLAKNILATGSQGDFSATRSKICEQPLEVPANGPQEQTIASQQTHSGKQRGEPEQVISCKQGAAGIADVLLWFQLMDFNLSNSQLKKIERVAEKSPWEPVAYGLRAIDEAKRISKENFLCMAIDKSFASIHRRPEAEVELKCIVQARHYRGIDSIPESSLFEYLKTTNMARATMQAWTFINEGRIKKTVKIEK